MSGEIILYTTNNGGVQVSLRVTDGAERHFAKAIGETKRIDAAGKKLARGSKDAF